MNSNHKIDLDSLRVIEAIIEYAFSPRWILVCSVAAICDINGSIESIVQKTNLIAW